MKCGSWHRTSNIIFLLAYFLFPAALPASEALNLLDGWYYAPGNHNYASTAPDWHPVDLPKNFSTQKEFHNYRGWITLKKKLPLQVNEWRRSNIPLAVRTGTISDVAELYINDFFIARRGNADPYIPGLYRFILSDVPGKAIRENQENYLVLKIFSDGQKPIHVSGKTLQLGPAQEVYKNYYQNEILQFSLLSIYLVVGLYHLLLAIKRRKEIYNFFFGAFCVLVSFYWFLFTGSRDLLFQDYQILRTKMEYSVVFILPSTLLFFLSYLFQRPDKKINRYFHRATIVYTIFVVTLALIAIFGQYRAMQVSLKTWQFSLPVVLISFLSFVSIEAFRRNKDAQYLIGGTAILLFGVAYDLAIALNLIYTERISQYTFLAFVLAIAAILSNRFVRLHNQVEELNANLEIKVQDRTRELQETLQEVRELKEQQDGDYFLTSLLLAPLSKNNNQNRMVHIDTYIRQKKQFQFRKWQREIGGDMNIAHNIKLRDREYAVFVNADAMGKSLQGAGGALVFGAVFLSIIERSKLSPSEKKKSPEQWLRDSFIEIQKVFESFDGSMLLSLVFGILDTQSGLMYLLNAEHPLPVLFRDGKASFIEMDVIFRKLGSSVIHGKMQIQTFQLLSGDIVILGSDGRDDILLPGKNGEKVINEDETLFLECVEHGQGNLEKIVTAIQSKGDLYDDLSLMKIEFDPEQKLLQTDSAITASDAELIARLKAYHSEENKTDLLNQLEHRLRSENIPLRILREAVKLYTRLQKYELAAMCVERYLEIKPADTEYFFAASYIYRRHGNLDKAIDYGERLRIRHPKHRKNLLQLAENWLEAGNPARARQLLQEVKDAGTSEEDLLAERAEQLLQQLNFNSQQEAS